MPGHITLNAISARTLIRGWATETQDALTKVANYEKSRSAGLAGFFSIISLLASVAIYKIYHSLHTEEKKEQFFSVTKQVAYATIKQDEKNNNSYIEVNQFILVESRVQNEDGVTVTDRNTGKSLWLKGTLTAIKEKAYDIVKNETAHLQIKAERVAEMLFSSGTPEVTDAGRKELIEIYCMYSDFQHQSQTIRGEFDADKRHENCMEYLRWNPEKRQALEKIFPMDSENSLKHNRCALNCSVFRESMLHERKNSIDNNNYLVGMQSLYTSANSAIGILLKALEALRNKEEL